MVVVLWSDNSARSRWVHNEAIGAIFGLKYYPLMQSWIDRGWKVHEREHAELTALLDRKRARDASGADAAMGKPSASAGSAASGKQKSRWWPFG